VCDDEGLPGLRTSDGLGTTVCTLVTADGDGDHKLMEGILPPADNGALDGFSIWVDGGMPGEVDETDPRERYDSSFPFMRLIRDNGGELPGEDAFPLQCRSPIECTGQEYDEILEDLAADGPARAIVRLRGLALALHMVQDLTTPHHLAPTTGYGHTQYEAYFEGFFWPNDRFIERHTIAVTHGVPFAFYDVEPDDGDAALPGAARWAANTPDAGDLWTLIVDEAETGGFWEEVDEAYDTLAADMAALADGTDCPPERFSSRRLARATAFETARIVAQSADLPGADVQIVPATDPERSQAFWVYSAIAEADETLHPEEDDATDPPARTVHEVPTWRAVALRTLPFLVAASAHMLVAAAEADADPRTTCDGGGDLASPKPDEGGPSCIATRQREIMSCVGAPGGPGCAAYTALGSLFTQCSGPLGLVADDVCGPLVLALAQCRCTAGSGSSEALFGCASQELSQRALVDLLQAGKIDAPTYLRLRGVALDADTDSDGIPDSTDVCDTTGGGAAPRWPRTNLSTGVCWLDDHLHGRCQYGCAPPTP
jgi:hypothetical protein